jgi:hypothetical protein
MNSKAALCLHLLKGEVVNIGSGFKLLGITNVPREIGRSIERSFDVVISRVQKEGKTRYGVPCNWVDYRLNFTDYNKPGIEKMRAYVRQHQQEISKEKTFTQPALF